MALLLSQIKPVHSLNCHIDFHLITCVFSVRMRIIQVYSFGIQISETELQN